MAGRAPVLQRSILPAPLLGLKPGPWQTHGFQ